MKKLFKMDGINKKICIMVSLIIVISLSGLTILNYVISKNELNRSNKLILSNAVNMVLAEVERGYTDSKDTENSLTEEWAKENALSFIKQLHGLSKDAVTGATEQDTDSVSGATEEASDMITHTIDLGESGYFYIINSQGDIIFHPFLTENLYELQSVDGRYIIQDIIGSTKQEGTYVNYALKEDVSLITESKTVYADSFEEWDWIVAAVIYDTELARGSTIILGYNLVGLLIVLCIALTLTIILSSKITKPIKQISRTLSKLAQGDLTTDKIIVKSQDETKQLGDSVNLLTESLNRIVKLMISSSDGLDQFAYHLNDSADVVSEATTEVAKAISMMAESSEEQFRETSESVQKVQLLGDDIKATADASIKIEAVIQQSIELKNEGLDSVGYLKNANEENNTNSKEIEALIGRINEQSLDISDITAIISNVAKQTNLLALNASIEASRAGEHGSGFAVVAEEIRKLANETAVATSNITKKIDDMQQQSEAAVDFMNRNKSSVQRINQSVLQTEEVIGRISDGLLELVKGINIIVNNNIRINSMKDEIITLLNHVNYTAEDNSASIQEISASSQEQSMTIVEISNSITRLYDMVKELNDLINNFKIAKE